MKKILILDTCILCVWLKVKNMETCGPDKDRWNYEKVKSKIDSEINDKSLLVLPLACIIETGNHITQSNRDKSSIASSFADLINNTIDGNTPWATFTEQKTLWEGENLKNLVVRWKDSVNSNHSLGDASIVDVAKFYASIGYNVEILTGDEGLKAYQPIQKVLIPRRRK